MASRNHVENPFEFVLKGFSRTGHAAPADPAARARARTAPQVRSITAQDLKAALRAGMDDFMAARDDVVFIAIIYPLAGLLLAGISLHYELLPLLFPLLSGFALVGPFAAVGLYEISRRREAGENVSWMDAAGVFRSPAAGSILAMGLIVAALFVLWLAVGYAVTLALFGSEPPPNARIYLQEMFATGAGWRFLTVLTVIGFFFALAALAVSLVTFPLLLDRNVDLDVAVATSLRVVAQNPGTVALWGVIVAGGLILGSLPALLGLIVVVPVLGHATWHLYRRAIA